MALICVSPLLIVVAVWLGLTPNPSPRGEGNFRKGNFLKRWFDKVFFLQERPGKDGRIFRVIKFKTMTDERGADGELLPDEQRLTKAGQFVRSTSIDELPQLINVLKGDMSLIGPRPLLVQYLPLYSKEQMRRHDVRPGISGWAQVHGRNLCKLSKKFEYDVWYVDHCTLKTDLKIIWLTIKNVLRRSNVGEGAGNMEEIDDLHFAERMK